MKKLITITMSLVLLFGIITQTFAAYGKDRAKEYTSGESVIEYVIADEWDGHQQIQITITNKGTETLRNWAVMFNCTGEISKVWNARVISRNDDWCVIKNNGYNYEITPGGITQFGFQLTGEDLVLPESMSICSKTVDATESAEISYEVTDIWDDGFIMEVSVTNNSEIPLEAWRLAFNGNFEIINIWDANKVYSEDGFLVENNVTTTPIMPGETKSFSFQGTIVEGEVPELTDFALTSVVVDVTAGGAEQPVEPIDPETSENYILCLGEYIEEENTLEIYWYSTAEGKVSLCESTGSGSWTTFAEDVEGEAYKYEIGDDFLVKLIKAVQETENGTLESEPFVVTNTEDGIFCTWLDSDEDKLADLAEKTFGTDPENPDTDGDGLTDYEEIYITGTNPLKYDTDENGLNDAEDDMDGDGLSNKEEMGIGTSAVSADTDEDGLSDYDEINQYNTDPLKADTDDDMLNDGEETTIGLDPNNPETFGVPDAEYRIEQSVSADSETMSQINTEESPYELSLEILATGNADTRLCANESTYAAVTESDARLGGAVELRYLGGDVDKVKLAYKIDDEYLCNANEENAENDLGLQGIERYYIFRYFEEINMLLPVATEFDEESNTLYAETDELGTYCVLDLEVMMRNFDACSASEEISTQTVSRQMYSSAPASTASTEPKSDKYCVTFVIDVRKDALTTEQMSTIVNEINKFAVNSYLEKRNVTIRIVAQGATDFNTVRHITIGEYTTPNALIEGLLNVGILPLITEDDFFGNLYVVTDSLADIIEHCNPSENNFVFDIFSQENAVYEQEAANDLCKNAKKKGVNISIISLSQNSLTGFQQRLVNDTNGIEHTKSYNFVEEVYEHVYKEKYVPKETMSALLSTGFSYILLDSKLYPNGKNPCGKDSDTDNDGVTDWDEVRNELLKYDDNGNYTLPTIGDCIGALDDVPFYVENVFKSQNGLEDKIKVLVFSRLWDYEILPIKSDPTSVDGDEDGFDDSQDLVPLVPFVNPIILLHGRTSNTLDTFGVPTVVCPYKMKPYNNHYDTSIISTGNNNYMYNDVNTHIIDSKNIKVGSLGAALVNKGYIANKNLFAFNYPNQDFAIKNGEKLKKYIEAVKLESEKQSGKVDKFYAVASDIFATKNDLDNNHARFILIGHSNGGLVSRYYIENLDGDVNVDKLITIDTPHYGSDLASLTYLSQHLGWDTDFINIIVPLDLELRPDSSLFTGNYLNMDETNLRIMAILSAWSPLSTVTLGNYCNTEKFKYIQSHQTDKLVGNTSNSKIKTDYYAIGGVSMDIVDGMPFYNKTMVLEFEPDYSLINHSMNNFNRMIQDLAEKEHPTAKAYPDLYMTDNIVELSSQLGIQYRYDRVTENVSFKRMAIIAHNGLIYTTLNHYHGAILYQSSLHQVVQKYILD